MDITLQEVADIVDESRGRNYFSNQLESALSPLFKKLKGIEKSKEEVSLMHLFKLDDVKSAKFKQMYENALKMFIQGFESKVKEFKSMNIMDVVVGGTHSNKTPIKTPTSKLPESFRKSESTAGLDKMLKGLNTNRENGFTEFSRDNIIDVNLTSISEKVLERLGSASNTVATVVSNDSSSSSSSGDRSGSLLGKILKSVTIGGIAAGLLAGGISLALKGLVDGGPTKGLFKLIGNILIGVGTKIYSKFLGMVSGFFRPIGKMLNLKVLKGVVKGGTPKGVFGFLGKILKPLKNIAKLAGKGMKLVFKSIPLLGSIVSLAFAVSRFKEGDIIGGMLELTSALLGLIPYPGLALIPDVFLMFRDFTMTKEEKQSQGGDFFSGVKKWLLGLPVVKAMVNLFQGLGLIFNSKSSNDIDKGLLLLRDSGDILHLIPFASFMLNVIEIVQNPTAFMDKAKSVISSVGDGIGRIWGMISNVFKTIWKWWNNMIVNIWESDAVKTIRLKISKGINIVKSKFIDGINVLIDVMNAIPKYVEDFVNDIVGGANYLLPEWAEFKNVDFGGVSVGKMDNKTQGNIEKIDKELRTIKERQIKRELEHAKMLNERDNKKADARHEDLKKTLKDVAGAQVAATNNSADKIASTIIKRDSGGGTTNIFTDNLSKQNENVRSRVFEHVFGVAVAN